MIYYYKMIDYLLPIFYTTCLTSSTYILCRSCIKRKREEEYRRNQIIMDEETYKKLIDINKQPTYEEIVQNSKNKQYLPPNYEDIKEDKIIIDDIDDFNDEVSK